MRSATRAMQTAALAAGFALAAGALAEPARYKIDPAHTFPQFAVSHLGFSIHRGRFNRSAGSVELDAAAGKGRIEVNIAADSVDTGDAELEQQLRGPNFFNVTEHPAIRFVAEAIDFDGDRPRAAHGQLTLLGVTQPITVTVERFHCGLHPLLRQQICGANATATLRRSAFGMSKFLSMVSDEVTISLQVEAVLETAAATTERLERGR